LVTEPPRGRPVGGGGVYPAWGRGGGSPHFSTHLPTQNSEEPIKKICGLRVYGFPKFFLCNILNAWWDLRMIFLSKSWGPG